MTKTGLVGTPAKVASPPFFMTRRTASGGVSALTSAFSNSITTTSCPSSTGPAPVYCTLTVSVRAGVDPRADPARPRAPAGPVGVPPRPTVEPGAGRGSTGFSGFCASRPAPPTIRAISGIHARVALLLIPVSSAVSLPPQSRGDGQEFNQRRRLDARLRVKVQELRRYDVLLSELRAGIEVLPLQ